MLVNPEEIIIHGTTNKGKVFRPSDWAERLGGILSSFNKDHRLSYNDLVRPVLLEKIRCVAIMPQLEEVNPSMFRFLMDFAADNNLRVLTYGELLAESGIEAESVPRNAPINPTVECIAPVVSELEKEVTNQSNEAPMAAVLREIGAHETSAAFAALSVLRPKLKDINGFVEQINKVQRPQGYRLLGIFEDGRSNAVAVCGFREETNLVSGKHMHIDDLVTVPQYRKHGYGMRLLSEVQRIARDAGVKEIHIDSNVGGERTAAHRIYFRQGFEIAAYHFVCDLDNLKL